MKAYLIATAMLCAAVAAPAAAQDTPKLAPIIQALEDKGYQIREVDVDRDKIQIEARRSDGVRVDLDLHPTTGEILLEELEG